MAETLPTLIKLAGRKVEAVQQELARVRAAVAAFEREIELCEEDSRRGFEAAAEMSDPLGLQAAGAFAARMRQKVEELREVIRALEVKQEELRAQLQQVYAEQKRYELLQERKELAARRERAKKAQERLDDLSQRR